MRMFSVFRMKVNAKPRPSPWLGGFQRHEITAWVVLRESRCVSKEGGAWRFMTFMKEKCNMYFYNCIITTNLIAVEPVIISTWFLLFCFLISTSLRNVLFSHIKHFKCHVLNGHQMYQTVGFLFSFTIRITIINENFASEVTFYFKIKCYRSISKSVMFGCNCWSPWQFWGSMQPWEFMGKEPARAGVQDGHPSFQEPLFGILGPTGALSTSGFRLSAFLEASALMVRGRLQPPC